MTLQIKKYVLGFAFWRDQVALIYKTKGPEYVLDTWNGIGGKIEADETGSAAMSREFFEETGLQIDSGRWGLFASQDGDSQDGSEYSLRMYSVHLPWEDDFTNIENTEGDGEIVNWTPVEYIRNGMLKVPPNLNWIIPLALDGTTGFLDIREY